ncbi:hypothetical protein E2K93_00950 [Thalassotalea sp. HSM 43]|uniref:hypothetical protein n=1 Tax=Thalassotalea sp. HSM 43 TaxID=2552945 RepID=UPI001080E853|nr:hypothetical protein [Thalassotalea sp. HSM 43]QBY03025.1 hypothetical protein E2K93_00950 [Thalassotalea sp. HSM 43]
MPNWLIILICLLALAAIVGNLSLLRRSNSPIRRKSLNDLEETLPRAGDKREQDIKQSKNRKRR